MIPLTSADWLPCVHVATPSNRNGELKRHDCSGILTADDFQLV